MQRLAAEFAGCKPFGGSESWRIPLLVEMHEGSVTALRLLSFRS